MEDIRDEKVQDQAAADRADAAQASGETTGQTGRNPETEPSGGCDSSEDEAFAKEASDMDSSSEGHAAEASGTAQSDAGSADTNNSGENRSGKEDSGRDTASEETEKKGFFSKKKKDRDKRDQQIEELTDRVQRQMAEFDNFRKRSEKEKASMFEVGAKSVLEKVLPTVDNFERGFANLSEEQKQDAFVQGMEKIYRQLLTALDGIGVKPIEAVGQPFDPNFHNAVMHVEDEEAGENMVVEEFQKGYLYRDSVLRHSMVKVAN